MRYALGIIVEALFWIVVAFALIVAVSGTS
jgi:hypothetical protein